MDAVIWVLSSGWDVCMWLFRVSGLLILELVWILDIWIFGRRFSCVVDIVRRIRFPVVGAGTLCVVCV